jgi:hypothetical protein
MHSLHKAKTSYISKRREYYVKVAPMKYITRTEAKPLQICNDMRFRMLFMADRCMFSKATNALDGLQHACYHGSLDVHVLIGCLVRK